MEVEQDATIVKCEVLQSGAWGDGPALVLVFQTTDGRTTEPSFFPGASAIEGLFELVGARIVQDLVGVCLPIIVVDDKAAKPQVKEVLTSHYVAVPDAFRTAFENDDG